MRSVSAAFFVFIFAAPTVAQAEKVDLESTFVGDKEQPAVSYFIPWEPPNGPDDLYRPIKSISGNVLQPVDRDILANKIRFYDELSLETQPTVTLK